MLMFQFLQIVVVVNTYRGVTNRTLKYNVSISCSYLDDYTLQTLNITVRMCNPQTNDGRGAQYEVS